VTAPGWWRRQWPWLLGAVVLAAGAVVGPHLDRKREFRTRDAEAARAVPAGAWGRYAGAEWRLRGLALQDQSLLPRDLLLPGNARVAVVELEIRPDQTTTGESNVARCSLLLRDDHGRSWRFAPEALTTYSRRAGHALDCARPRGAPDSGPYTVRLPFLLPDDVRPKDLRLELQLFPLPPEDVEPAGAYLDMALPGGR